jgi:hypothetical protein
MNSGFKQNTPVMAGFETVAAHPGGWLDRLRGRVASIRSDADPVWSRGIVLLAVLFVIKIVMLLGMRKHLSETHWRIGSQPLTWANIAGFYLFALLAGTNLWLLGSQCARAGVRVVRWANAFVVVLGGAFILLTFHEGDKNYLDPLMSGLLGWKGIGSYLSLNLFFRAPFLAVWIFVYGALYYILARTGREASVLRVTAVFATAFLALCVRDVGVYHDDLIIADALGLASLWRLSRNRGRSGWLWLALTPLGLASAFALYTGSGGPSLLDLYPEFAVLFWGSIVLFAGLTLVAWRRGFLASWSALLPFAFGAFLLFSNTNYGPSGNYNNLLCLGLTLPRYFMGECFVAAAVVATGLLWRQWRPHGSLVWLDVVNVLLIAWALADLRLSEIMGMRLDWPALSLALGETPKMMWRMAEPYLPALVVAIAVVVAVYAGALRLVSGWGMKRTAGSWPLGIGGGGGSVLLSFVLLGAAGTWVIEQDKARGESALVLAATSPVFQRAAAPLMPRDEFIAAARQLGMEQMLAPRPAPSHAPADLNVILIFQESSYNKYLSLFDGAVDTQPLLSRYKDRMELFPNFFSNFAGSINARFASFTGLYPLPDYTAFTVNHVGVKSVFEILHERGWDCSMFYSSSFDYTGFRDFLRGRDLDGMYDADTMPGVRTTQPVSWGLREEETMRAIQQQIRKYANDRRRFFLTYVPAAPHNPFDATPDRFRKYRKETVGDFTPVYLNELLYMDWVIASIVDQVKEAGLLDRTLIIITDDHGEMLGENGGPIGHGAAVTPELANVPLIIMDPRRPGYRVNDTIGSQVDLLPTMLDLLGIAAPREQLYQGTSLYSARRVNRAEYLSSFRQYGILFGDEILCGDRQSRAADLFRMTNSGAKTMFTAVEAPATNQYSIADFDRFQRSLLRHYSEYEEVRRADSGGIAASTVPGK